MSTQTDTVAKPGDQRELTPQWLYDELMQHIEPDLTTSQIGSLPEKYKNETPEDKAVRMESYALAFQIFNESVEDLRDIMDADAALWTAELDDIYAEEKKHDQDTGAITAEHALDDEIDTAQNHAV